MNERLTEATTALLLSKEVREEFRSSPTSVGDRFDLSADEVEALKSGDERLLLDLGLNPTVVFPEVGHSGGWASTIMKAAAKAATPIVAALMIMLGSAAPARATETARGRATDGARASIRLLRSGVVELADSRVRARAARRALSLPLELTGDVTAHEEGLARARFAIPSSKELP